MNWKVCYKKDMESGSGITSIAALNDLGLTQIKAEFPSVIPDNTNCFYFAEFTAFEYDYLSIEGIDCIAEIFINGNKVFVTDTNFADVEIKDGIVTGENEVIIFVHPKFGKASAIHNISIKRRRKCELLNISQKTLSIDEDNDIAVVGVTADVKIRDDSTHDFNNLSYKIILKDEKKTYIAEGALNYSHIDAKIEIQRPRLWWPKNYGKAVLYESKIIILDANRELCEYDAELPVSTIEHSVGASLINGKQLNLIGPVVPSFDNLQSLLEKLDALGSSLCILPKSYEKISMEILEQFFEHGIVVIFKNVIPEGNISVLDTKKAIEAYRINKMYRPSWTIPENKKDFSLIHNVNQPLCLIIDEKTNSLVCVSDLTYAENITYVIKDLSDGDKIISTGITDVAPDSCVELSKIATIPGHSYQISWTTNSGKVHFNCY